MNKWYFAQESNPSNNFSDEFSDSKFSIDKWNSFVREIIQNSLDVNIDKNTPVKIVFDYKEIETEKIPGTKELLEDFQLCLEEELNVQTKAMYTEAVKMLQKPMIPCLKISDFNTKGVQTDINGDWGAFVYDNGKSSKYRPGSAGSHGVGKKVPFIVSSVNTVFYNTLFYENYTRFFQGKTSLVNFKRDGITFSSKGWFGKVDEDNEDRRLKVQPINNFDELDNYDEFFSSRYTPGTDVIVIGTVLEPTVEDVKSKIINAVFENFFIGIVENKLVVEVFGTEINCDNVRESIDKYYKNDTIRQTKISEYDFVRNGNLRNYISCLDNEPVKLDIKVGGRLYGYLDIYFDLKNDKNKKYYCFFRDHGMKIQDLPVDADQPYSAVVIARDFQESPLEEKERLNAKLASRENAAHDTFVINDEKFPCDDETKELINKVYEVIEEYIKNKTEIKTSEDTPIYSLTDMMSLEGVLSTATIKKTPKISKKKRKIKKQSNVHQTDNYEDAAGTKGGKKVNPNPTPNPGPAKPAAEGGDDEGIVFKQFNLEPKFYNFEDCYELRVQPQIDIECNIKLVAYTIDGGTVEFPFMIEKSELEGNDLKVENSTIKNVKLYANRVNKVKIILRKGLDYNLDGIFLVKNNYEN